MFNILNKTNETGIQETCQYINIFSSSSMELVAITSTNQNSVAPNDLLKHILVKQIIKKTNKERKVLKRKDIAYTSTDASPILSSSIIQRDWLTLLENC